MVRSPQKLVVPFAALSFAGRSGPSISLVPPTASPASPVVSFNTNPEFLAIPVSSKDARSAAIDLFSADVHTLVEQDIQPASTLKPCLKRRRHVKQDWRQSVDPLQVTSSSHVPLPSPSTKARAIKLPRPIDLQWSKQPIRPDHINLSTIGETEECGISVGTTTGMDAASKWEHHHFTFTGHGSEQHWLSFPTNQAWDELSSSIKCEIREVAESPVSTTDSSSSTSSRRVRFADEVGGDLSRSYSLGQWFQGDEDLNHSDDEPAPSECSDSEEDYYVDCF